MVNGQITDAGKAIGAALQKHKDWFDASTLKVWLMFLFSLFTWIISSFFIYKTSISFAILSNHYHIINHMCH